MGANHQATLFELQHRDLLRGVAEGVANQMGLDSFGRHKLFADLLSEFNSRRLWIIPANVDAARKANS